MSRSGNWGRGIGLDRRDKMVPNVGLEVTDTDPPDSCGGLGIVRSARIDLCVVWKARKLIQVPM